MKILHGIRSMGGGGAERQLRNLSLGFADRHVQSIFAMEPGPFEADVLKVGIKVHRTNLGQWRLPLAIPYALKLVIKDRPDILLSWDPTYDVLFSIISKLTGIRYVASERNAREQYTHPDGFGNAWFRNVRGPSIRSHASLAIANSRGGKEYLDEICAGKVPVVVVRNGLDFAGLDAGATRQPDPSPKFDRFILTANRLSGTKQTDRVIKMLAELRKSDPAIGLVVLGTGPQSDLLKALPDELGLTDWVQFTGQVNNVSSYVHRATMFISASAVEGMPNSVLEAMAIGIPTVVSDIPSHREIAEDTDGGITLVDPNDTLQFAAKVKAVLTDEVRLRAQIANAKDFARGLTIDRMTSEFESHLTNLLGRSAKVG
jgi:glycosyltransferase involved in cell wall biosynthesis